MNTTRSIDPVKRIFSILAADGTLFCEHVTDKPTCYWCSSSTDSFGPKASTVQKCLDLGVIEPVGDGLFPGCTRSYRLANRPGQTLP